MQIRNPYAGSGPLQVTAITSDNHQYPMSLTSYPFIAVDDDVAEMLVRWTGPGYDVSKAWTKDNGWLEMDAYQERKRFEQEKRQLEEDKKRFNARKERTQLDVKVTPLNEDNPTTPDPE